MISKFIFPEKTFISIGTSINLKKKKIFLNILLTDRKRERQKEREKDRKKVV